MTSEDSIDLFIPPIYDLATTALILLAVVAIVSVVRHGSKMTMGQILGWSALVTVVPLFGPFAWFLAGRKRAIKDSTDQQPA